MTIQVYTIPSEVPIQRYTGNGAIVIFQWKWSMLAESSIEVLVDNEYVDGWTLQGTSVVFDIAPANGAEIVIYRRTKIWMPEDYVAYGRFHPHKTELSVDRAIMIAQEYAGDRGIGNAPNGIVGAADLRTRRNEFDIDLISERGKDTVIPMWSPDGIAPPPVNEEPDPSILWGGEELIAKGYSYDGVGTESYLVFSMIDSDSNHDTDPNMADYRYRLYTEDHMAFEDWVDHIPANNEYWMRVFNLTPEVQKTRLSNGKTNIEYGVAFPLYKYEEPDYPGIWNTTAALMTAYTYSNPAPSVITSRIRVEICKAKDGLPDGKWAKRNVTIQAIFNG